MGKRQTRIFARDIFIHLPSLINQEANVLLKNGTIFHGTIKQSSESTMHLIDMLGRKHIVNVQSIAEIILDKETLY